jgi:hypothetical protein
MSDTAPADPLAAAGGLVAAAGGLVAALLDLLQ